MFSIYSQFFNVEKMGFDWRGAITNWSNFLIEGEQISIAVNQSDDNSLELIREFCKTIQKNINFTITSINIPYTDPAFDGKGKNEALKLCKESFCILLDCDERIDPSDRKKWEFWARTLDNDQIADAMFIPVIDLFHDKNNFKSVGTKWYIHKNRPYLHRGVVNFAYRKDKSIDITRSDTCELLREDDNLAFTVSPIPHVLSDINKLNFVKNLNLPLVIHLGWVEKQQRLKQSNFWTPVWNKRNGWEVEKKKTLEQLDLIPYYPHNLKLNY